MAVCCCLYDDRMTGFVNTLCLSEKAVRRPRNTPLRPSTQGPHSGQGTGATLSRTGPKTLPHLLLRRIARADQARVPSDESTVSGVRLHGQRLGRRSGVS
jgi:hypothetical protein